MGFGKPQNSVPMFGMPDYIKNMNQQPSAIQAPQGRGMFGRFANMLGKGGAGEYGKSGMSNALFLLGAGLGGASAGNPAMTAQMMSGRKAELTEDRERERIQALTKQAAGGDMRAIGMLDPIAAQNMRYRNQRDTVGDQRYQKEYTDKRQDRASDVNHRDLVYNAGRDDRADDVAWRESRAGVTDEQWASSHSLQSRGVDLQESALNAKMAESSGPDVSGESTLRKEFLSQNKPFQEVQRAYDRVKAVDTSNAAGQMGLIFQYMKMLDPGSTVREGEFATAQNTTGVPGMVINAYNKARAGEFLNPDQVSDFRLQADNLYVAAAEGFDRSFNDYRTRSDSYGFDQARTIPDLRNSAYGDPMGGPEVPSGAVQMLRQNATPEMRAAFDDKYGQGAAASILGE